MSDREREGLWSDVRVYVCTYPNVSIPKGACAYFHQPLIPPASIDMTAGPERREEKWR